MFQDPKRYQAKHDYVTAAGVDLVEILGPQVGERILDLGCGTGQLSAQIAAAGAEVVGIDLSAEMVETAREQFPGLSFVVGDAEIFPLSNRSMRSFPTQPCTGSSRRKRPLRVLSPVWGRAGVLSPNWVGRGMWLPSAGR